VATTQKSAYMVLLDKLRARVRETTVAEVAERQKRGDRFHLVDVREDDEWRTGKIPGAIHIGKGVIERDIESKIPAKNDEIILYCRSGTRSVLAADALQQMGYTNVASMAGGIKDWLAAKLPDDKS
jgi:rhodanese-related sulfurtransferase